MSSNSVPSLRPDSNPKSQSYSAMFDGPEKPQMIYPHKKPWTLSACPGKHESNRGINGFHRVWNTDTGPRGKWNRDMKRDFYRKQDEALGSSLSHDELHHKSPVNYKMWTHLMDGGLTPGGQDEKLSYAYQGPNKSSTHFYVGKYENVRHTQKILTTGWKHPDTEELREVHTDTRRPWQTLTKSAPWLLAK